MTGTTALAIRDDQVVFDDLQKKALAHMGVADATSADLAVFFHVARQTGLDPFARQIHMIGRNTKNQRTQQWETKYTIQTGIDGYRLIARRAAGPEGYGYEDPQWCGPDGAWVDVWTSDEPPHAARVVVVRGGKRFPAVARYKAYVQTKKDGEPNSIWAQRDAEQLEKCAEALALRKAFPQDLSGIYTEDEMRAQPATAEPAAPAAPRVTAADFTAPAPDTEPVDAEEVTDAMADPDADGPEPATPAQIGAMHAAFTRAGITDRGARLDYCARLVGRALNSSKDLTRREASLILDALKTDEADAAWVTGADQ